MASRITERIGIITESPIHPFYMSIIPWMLYPHLSMFYVNIYRKIIILKNMTCNLRIFEKKSFSRCFKYANAKLRLIPSSRFLVVLKNPPTLQSVLQQLKELNIRRSKQLSQMTSRLTLKVKFARETTYHVRIKY